MKKLVKIIPVMLLIIVLASAFVPVFAASITNPSSLTGEGTDKFDKIGKQIIGMVQAIGSIVSVLVLVILGIKYMMGSAEEKAEYKKTMIPYLVGAILIFGASAITKVVVGLAQGITN